MSDDAGSSSPVAALMRDPTADAALASWRAARHPRPADRPSGIRLDSGINVGRPAPRILANYWALPTLAAAAEVYSSGPALVTRPHGSTDAPTPVDFLAAAAALRDLLAELPALDDEPEHYADLRLYVRHGNPSNVREYLRDVVKAARIAAPRWRPPAVRKERTGPPPTATERKRTSRDRHRAREVESAEHWLRGWLDEAAPGRYDARELHAQAVDALEEFVEWYEDDAEGWAEEAAEDGSPAVPVVPGVKAFYAAGDRLIGPRSRTAAGYVYTVPEPAVLAEVTDRVGRLAWADQREILLRVVRRRMTATAARKAAA